MSIAFLIMRINDKSQNANVGVMIVDSEMLAISSTLATIMQPAAWRLCGRALRGKALGH